MRQAEKGVVNGLNMAGGAGDVERLLDATTGGGAESLPEGGVPGELEYGAGHLGRG